MTSDLMRGLHRIEVQNTRILRNLIVVTFLIGVNVTPPTRAKNKLKILNVVLQLISSVGIYAQTCFIRRHLSEEFTVYSEALCSILQTVVAMVKMSFFFFTEQQFYRLLHKAQTSEVLKLFGVFDLDINVKSEISNEICDILTSAWRDVHRQLRYYFYAVFAIVIWGIVHAVVVNEYHSYKKIEHFDIQLPFLSLFPMWESKGMAFPYYHIQMFIMSVQDFTAGFCALSFDGIFLVLAVHGTALIRILRKMLRYATKDGVPSAQRVEYLRCCVKLYQRIYHYYDAMNTLYKYVSLSQFFFSLLILCMVFFQASVGLEQDIGMFLKMVCYMMAAGFEILLYCFNGQRLTTESEKLPQSWFDCEWYNESKDFKFIIKMMIMRTNRNFPVHVGGFTTMSMVTLVSLFQTSGSYYVLLRNVSGND